MAKKPAPKPPANKPNNNNNKPNNNKPSNNKPAAAPKAPAAAPKAPAAAPKAQQNAASLPSYQNDQGPVGNTAPTTTPLSIEDAQASRDSTSTLRYPNQDQRHWTNADYGDTFGMKDIKEWQERWGQGKNKKGEREGYKNNEIMKIAQAAYASGHVKNVNKLNEYFGKMNSEYYNPRVLDGVVKGQETSMTVYPWMSGGKSPKRAFEWNGFGNGMTKHERNGIPGFGSGSYEKGAQWSLPTSLQGGFSPIPTAPADDLTDPAGDSTAGAGTDGTTDDGSGVDTVGGDNSASQFGVNSDVTSNATSFRSATGRRGKAGRGAQGTSSMKNPLSNAWGVGVRSK